MYKLILTNCYDISKVDNKIIKDKRVHLGRPKYKLLDNSEDIIHKFHNKEITIVETAKILNMIMGFF